MPKEAVLVVVPQPHVDLVDGGGQVEAGTSTCTDHQAHLVKKTSSPDQAGLVSEIFDSVQKKKEGVRKWIFTPF